MSAPDAPPILPIHADLVMIFEVALQRLEEAQAEHPDDFLEVLVSAKVTEVALEHWIELAEARLRAH